MPQRLVLASASPRRKALLTEWGLVFEVRPPAVEETIEDSLEPGPQAESLAILKAGWLNPEITAQRDSIDEFVLAADTIVACERKQLGKPRDAVDAQQMLAILSARTVTVVTGVAVRLPSGRIYADFETSYVTMRAFGAAEIANYVASGEPFDKAGAFAIQGEGARLIASRSGSYSNVVGLPKSLTFRLLDEAGFLGTSV